MVEPARIQAQRQIVTRVNIQRPIIANIKKVNADSRQRQEMRVATGHKADTSAAQARIAAYEAAEKAKAEEAAAKAANTGNSV